MTLRLNGSTSGYVEIDAPAVAGTSALTLPTGTGTLATQASVGLVKIVDQSFTAASSVSVNNCFTSAYENYRILIGTTGSSTSVVSVFLRLRLSGSDSTSAYARAGYYNSNSGAGNLFVSGQNALLIGDVGNICGFQTVDINSPATTRKSAFTVLSAGYGDSTASALFMNGTHDAATAYDGLTIYPASGTITGTIRVYGYQN